VIKICIGKKVNENNCITIQTRKGNNIKNTVYDDKISKYFQHINSEYEKKYPKIKYRSKETSNYNCFGMVFASRRCFIFDNINNILKDDDYKEVPFTKVLPGDIVLYFDNYDIIHCGIVIEIPDEKNYWNPLVISKWHCFREVIHHINDCPYSPSTTERKYYRIFE
jgi:hypothetical protein